MPKGGSGIDVDPARITSWLKLAAYIGSALFVVAAAWIQAQAQDKANADAIVQEAKERKAADAAIRVDIQHLEKGQKQLVISTEKIAAIFKKDYDERQDERKARRAAAKLMKKLCKEETFRTLEPGDCSFYDNLKDLIGE